MQEARPARAKAAARRGSVHPRLRAATGLAAACLLLVGCGGGGDASETGTERAAAKQAQLDAPALGAIDDTFIVIVTAGATGAPAGFTLQWMTRADYDAFGWPVASGSGPRKSFCSGSFSGVPRGSIYSLPPGGSVAVFIGAGPPETGRSIAPACDVPLQCTSAYVFRAFAHAAPAGAARSDVGATLPLGPVSCDSGGGQPAAFTN